MAWVTDEMTAAAAASGIAAATKTMGNEAAAQLTARSAHPRDAAGTTSGIVVVTMVTTGTEARRRGAVD